MERKQERVNIFENLSLKKCYLLDVANDALNRRVPCLHPWIDSQLIEEYACLTFPEHLFIIHFGGWLLLSSNKIGHETMSVIIECPNSVLFLTRWLIAESRRIGSNYRHCLEETRSS